MGNVQNNKKYSERTKNLAKIQKHPEKVEQFLETSRCKLVQLFNFIRPNTETFSMCYDAIFLFFYLNIRSSV